MPEAFTSALVTGGRDVKGEIVRGRGGGVTCEGGDGDVC